VPVAGKHSVHGWSRPEGSWAAWFTTELAELVCDHWDKLGRIGLDDRKRCTFVTILERAVGAELQNKIDMVLSEASKASLRDPIF